MRSRRHRSLAIIATTLAGLVSGATTVFAAPPVREDAVSVQDRTEKEKAEQQREIERCFSSWDAQTRMTRAQFRAACTRVLGPHR